MKRKILATVILFYPILLTGLVKAEIPEYPGDIGRGKGGRNTENALQSPNTEGAQTKKESSRVRFRSIVFKTPNVRGYSNLETAPLGVCISSCPIVKPLLPLTNIGLTLAASPKIFVYLSQTTASKAEFFLIDPTNEDILYEATFSLPSQSGIISFNIPEDANSPKLTVGKKYRWYFVIVRDRDDRSADIIAEGSIQRVELNSTVASQLKKAPPEDHPAIYAAAGIWFETLASLAELRRSYPNDPGLAAAWKNLLESVVQLKVDNRNLVFPVQEIEGRQ